MGRKCVDALDLAPAEEAPALLQHCTPGVPVAVDDGSLVHVVGQQLLARLDTEPQQHSVKSQVIISASCLPCECSDLLPLCVSLSPGPDHGGSAGVVQPRDGGVQPGLSLADWRTFQISVIML